MIFDTPTGKKSYLSVAPCKETIDGDDVKAAMETIISDAVFANEINAIVGAEIVLREVTPLDVD
jgi:hypothetical protein